MYRYHLKSEFRSRLTRLHDIIGYYLDKDLKEGFSCPVNNLWPYLFRVYAYLWGNSVSDCFKKVYKEKKKD